MNLTSLGLCLAVTLLGGATDDEKREPPRVQTQPRIGFRQADAEALFRELTGSVWTLRGVTDDSDIPVEIVFRRNGTFIASDTPLQRDGEADRIRYWFKPTSRFQGVLHVTNGWCGSIKLTEEGLSFGAAKYRSGERNQHDAAAKKLRWKDLPVLKPSEQWLKFVKQRWTRSSDFGAYRFSEGIRFLRDGRFVASYRAGQCKQDGTWALHRGQSHLSPGRNCDQRYASPEAESVVMSHVFPKWVDGMLVVHDVSFYPGKKRNRRAFVVPRYGLGHRGHYDGPLVKGKAKTITLTHYNSDSYDHQLIKMSVSIRPARIAEGGLNYDDQRKVVLFERDLENALLARKGSFQERITITPPIDGFVYLKFKIHSRSDSQDYPHEFGYFLDIPRR